MIPKLVLPAHARAALYTLFNVIGMGLAATEAGFLAAGKHPTALTVALAVYGALSANVHALAARNTPVTQRQPRPAQQPARRRRAS